MSGSELEASATSLSRRGWLRLGWESMSPSLGLLATPNIRSNAASPGHDPPATQVPPHLTSIAQQQLPPTDHKGHPNTLVTTNVSAKIPLDPAQASVLQGASHQYKLPVQVLASSTSSKESPSNNLTVDISTRPESPKSHPGKAPSRGQDQTPNTTS